MTVSTAAITFVDFPRDKVTLAGNCGVGKTTLFLWFKEGRFVEDVRTVRNDGEHQRRWNIDDDEVSMTLFDTAGMESHNPRARLNSIYFRRSRVIIFVYDISDRESFDALTHWEDEAVQKSLSFRNTDVVLALVGNKLDLEDEREVTRMRALQFAENFCIPESLIFEVSAKNGDGVMEMFNDIVKIMSRQQYRSPKPPPKHGSCKC